MTTVAQIELSENSIQVLNATQFTSDHVLLVNVDTGNMPAHSARAYMTSIKDAFKEVIGDAKVIVHTKETKINLLHKSEIA